MLRSEDLREKIVVVHGVTASTLANDIHDGDACNSMYHIASII